DQLGGVDFAKGCYVGQEVVSRMEHRGTARNRVVPVAYRDFAPDAGIPVTAGERTVGTMGSSAKGLGLALLRLDRVADAAAAGTPLVAGGIEIRPVKPAWARFAWPGEGRAAEGRRASAHRGKRLRATAGGAAPPPVDVCLEQELCAGGV